MCWFLLQSVRCTWQDPYFNTSNVLVSPEITKGRESIWIDFNTSNVLVSHGRSYDDVSIHSNFNTSNVLVSLYKDGLHNLYHKHFNTSNVLVSRQQNFACLPHRNGFQYIKCVGFSRYALITSHILKNFNTSNVLVSLHRCTNDWFKLFHFNTSNVLVSRSGVITPPSL